jgi:lipopolysaccharide export system protein LptC
LIKLLLAAWDRLSLYLPVVLMGLLALGTYWLVQSTPTMAVPSVDGPMRHEPDYFMKNFSVRTFVDSGRLKSEVFGVAARHYPDSDTTEIDQVRIRAFDEQGRLTTATANRALTNSDGSEVELFGKALVVREAIIEKGAQTSPRLEFRGEYLHAFMDTERVQSNRPVELRRGSDVFMAETMDYDNQGQVMIMRGRVRGTLVPVAVR